MESKKGLPVDASESWNYAERDAAVEDEVVAV